MESPDVEQDVKTKMEFAVEMKTPCCLKKVERVISTLKGVSLVNLDLKSQRLLIEGGAAAESVKDAIERETGMSTVVMGQGTETDQNLGAGVAAISVGGQGVLGLLRLVQRPSSCLIDGTVDLLPTSQPVYLSLHESGDMSEGCNSCGDVFASNQQNGILGQISPDDKQRAEFRLNTGVKLADMIGRCVVVHSGSRDDVLAGKSSRLACGIVARASGLFQNPKRFCACDGVTIWEQKRKSDKCCKS